MDGFLFYQPKKKSSSLMDGWTDGRTHTIHHFLVFLCVFAVVVVVVVVW
jgi:hypothetical protein